jgi:dolichol kinase
VAATLAEIAPAPLNRVNDNVLVPLVAATAMTFIG